MGVIKKLLHRSQSLSEPRHRNLFLDMEENIHIHYRDLRIELSRKEFEDISSIFNRQSSELQGIIEEKNYQDGKLPNANQEDVRIWTESRLNHDVKYHPRRVSIEECGDGYHLHYRNYKLLIDHADFKQFVKIFQHVDINQGYAESYDEVLELLEVNDIDFTLDSGNLQGEVLSIAVAPHHLNKVRDIFGYIGFSTETEGSKRCYRGAQLKVLVSADKVRAASDYQQMRDYNSVGRLIDQLSRRGANIDPDELNIIKCQVLDLHYAIRSGKALNVEVNPQLWLYIPEEQKVIFPYSPQAVQGRQAAEKLYRTWADLMRELNLNFIKPTKAPFNEETQTTLAQRIVEAIRHDVASCGAVSKVWLMGSAARKGMGYYHAPFVHGKLTKLGSDVDILIEIDPKREMHIPRSWQLINPKSSNYCSVYHLSQIPFLTESDESSTFLTQFQSRFPNLNLIHHLIDAYVFFPSNGHEQEKDAFLEKFSAQLFYDRQRDGNINRGEEERRIAERILELYGLPDVVVEKMDVSTENGLYKVYTDQREYVLKFFKLAGNYSHKRVAEHTEYEYKLINQLHDRSVHTAPIIPTHTNKVETIEGWPAVLFEWLHGEIRKEPEYPLEQIAQGLAELHQTQIDQPLDLPATFLFEDFCSMWLNALQDYSRKSFGSQVINQTIAEFAPKALTYTPIERNRLTERSPEVHCHADVAPKNIMLGIDHKASYFDFNNAFFGPRISDVIDGAYELSLAEKYIDKADSAVSTSLSSNTTGLALSQNKNVRTCPVDRADWTD